MNQKTEKETHWILLRGLGRESRHWGDFPDLLKESIEKASGKPARVDGIDLPGTGRYSEMRTPVSIGRIAEFARGKFMEIRKAQREAGKTVASETFLVAVSLGGMVASRWLERWPEDFSGCVLMNSSFRGVSPFHRRLAPTSYVHLFNILRERDVLERERHVLRMVSNRPEIREETARRWAEIAHERPISHENFALQLAAAARFRSGIEVPPCPVLVLCSLADRMVHPSCSQTIADQWNTEIREHETAGHDLALDDGPWVARQIAEWRARLHRKTSEE